MKQNPLVSIALCTYNGAEFLAAQLDTLVSQTYQNIEIVVVDDCSTDSTLAILKDYASRYPQFKLHQNENNLGFTANFEKAAKLCSGELIALCDQDDLWRADKIMLQVEALKDNIFVYHDSEFIHEDGTAMNIKMSDLMNLYRGGEPEVFLFFNCVSGHSILMKRELLEWALPLKKEFFHDWWLAYVATNMGSIDFIPQCLVQYRQHDKSETNILRLDREKDNYKKSSIDRFEETLKWLSYCRSFKANKNQDFVEKLYSAYRQRAVSYFSFEFAILLLKHWKAIFFIRKKSTFSKLNYIRKQAWGIKMKRLLNKKSIMS
jgi:glycosyltransferase involved in cell wall biosynthesis